MCPVIRRTIEERGGGWVEERLLHLKRERERGTGRFPPQTPLRSGVYYFDTSGKMFHRQAAKSQRETNERPTHPTRGHTRGVDKYIKTSTKRKTKRFPKHLQKHTYTPTHTRAAASSYARSFFDSFSFCRFARVNTSDRRCGFSPQNDNTQQLQHAEKHTSRTLDGALSGNGRAEASRWRGVDTWRHIFRLIFPGRTHTHTHKRYITSIHQDIQLGEKRGNKMGKKRRRRRARLFVYRLTCGAVYTDGHDQQ